MAHDCKDGQAQSMTPHGTRCVMRADSLVSGYGTKRVLNSVSVAVHEGETVAIIGHNGAGKSTLLKVLFGMLPMWEGHILFDGQAMPQPNPLGWLSRGVAFVPQGNRVFGRLTVLENLKVAAEAVVNRQESRQRIEKVLESSPTIAARLHQLAGSLSGGEKQVLAVSMGLLTDPRVLLLDEPSLGLAPRLVRGMLGNIAELSRIKSTAIIIVEQKVREVLRHSDRVYVLRHGAVSFSGRSSEVTDDATLRSVYL